MSDSGSKRLRWFVAAAVVLGPLAVTLALHYGFDPVDWDGKQPLIHREDGFAGAAACESCHPDQFATWAKTYHRTMTQRAGRWTSWRGWDPAPSTRRLPACC
jgi:hypothetical protein